MASTWWYAVDGVEYPWTGLSTADGVGSTNTVGVNGGIDGDVRAVALEMDWFRVGYTGYESSEIFEDNFSSSGFTMWDSYDPGPPASAGPPNALLEGSGKLTLVYNVGLASSGVIEKDHSNSYGYTYWTMKVKCTAPSYPASGSPPGFTTASDGHFVITYYADRILAKTSSGISPDTVMVDLNDGDWHIIGIKRFIPGADENPGTTPISEIPGKLAYYHDGAWHIVRDI